MAKRKLQGELFSDKTRWSSTEVRHEIEFHDLLLAIKNVTVKKSPKFKIDDVEFSVSVDPWNGDNSGFISVYLDHFSDESQMISLTVKASSGEEASRQMEEVEAEGFCGFFEFLSITKYKEFAKDKGDVLKLELTVILHTKENAATEGWSR